MLYLVKSAALPCFKWIGDDPDEAERIAFTVAQRTGKQASVEELPK